MKIRRQTTLARLFGSLSAPAETPPAVALAGAELLPGELLPGEAGPTWTKRGASDGWQPQEPKRDADCLAWPATGGGLEERT